MTQLSRQRRQHRLIGAVAGLFAGLPALRLRTFYFAMTTLGLSTIVTQIALAGFVFAAIKFVR